MRWPFFLSQRGGRLGQGLLFDNLDRLLWPVPPQPAWSGEAKGSPPQSHPNFSFLKLPHKMAKGSCLVNALP